MSNRKEYLRNYYLSHKDALSKYYQEKYQADKKDRLTKARTYYRLNRTMILSKAKFHDTSKSGHAHAIYESIKKYAKKWKLPCNTWSEFKEWAMTDTGYETIYKQWEASEFEKTFSPVVIRGVKKNGFLKENLKWDYRENYSWWSSELDRIKEFSKELSDEQIILNKSSKEWKKKTYEAWKAKRKNK